jgi:hypothetical protein
VTSYESLADDSFDDKAVDAYVSVARFCDDQYRSIVDYMASKEYEDKQNLMEKIKMDAKDM